MRFAALAVLVGCTGVPAPSATPPPLPVAVSPVPSGLFPVDKVASLSTTLTNGDGLPRGFATIPGVATVFFSASQHGLWRTDGTPGGTYLLRDLAPLLDSFNRTPQVVVHGTRAYWTQNTELWSSDGISDVTRIAAFPQQTDELSNLIAYNGALYFSTDTQLYKSDGTVAGTQPLATVRAYSGSDYPKLGFQVGGGKLWFPCMLGGTNGACVTDGTAAGTKLIPGTTNLGANMLGYANGEMLFSGQVLTSGGLYLRALFSTDGTTTTKILSPATNGDAISTYEEDFAVLGSTAYFPCYTSAAGFELCKSDGTAAGTAAIDTIAGTTGISPRDFAVMGGALYFTATDTAHGSELWHFDPTNLATLYADLYPGNQSGMGGGGKLVVGSTLYFIATDLEFTHPYTLWKTDGATAPTLVKQIQTTGSQSYSPELGVALGGNIIFAAMDDTHGQEPWVSDGTGAGTLLLADTAPPTSDASVFEMSGYGNAVFFGLETANSEDLWRSDGTAAGTKVFQAVGQNIGLGAFQPTVFGSKLAFTTDGALWSIASPTATSATKILDLPGSAGQLNVVGGKLAFEGTTPDSAYALWLSDGTAAGTAVTDPVAYNASNLGVAGGKLWLEALDGGEGNELWTSDGTTTKVVADIYPGTHDSSPSGFAGIAGTSTVVFAANDGAHGYELWKTDGTSTGTALLDDLRAGGSSGSPFGMTSFGAGVLFWVQNAANTYDLWTTNGTTATLVKAIGSSSIGTSYKFLVWGAHAYFTAATDATGVELWRTDGTGAGTEMVTDLYAGPLSSSPSGLVLVTPDGPLVFAAEEPVHGRELYRLDTETGTPALAAEVAAGTHSGAPTLMTMAGPRLFFIADDDTGTGPAMFAAKLLPDAPPDGPPASGDGGMGPGSGTDGGNPATGGGGGGGGCCQASTDPRSALVLVGIVALLVGRRRRREA